LPILVGDQELDASYLDKIRTGEDLGIMELPSFRFAYQAVNKKGRLISAVIEEA